VLGLEMTDTTPLLSDGSVQRTADPDPYASLTPQQKACLEEYKKGQILLKQNHNAVMVSLYDHCLKKAGEGFSEFDITETGEILPRIYFYSKELEANVISTVKKWGFACMFIDPNTRVHQHLPMFRINWYPYGKHGCTIS
jgi:hypothetical protein